MVCFVTVYRFDYGILYFQNVLWFCDTCIIVILCGAVRNLQPSLRHYSGKLTNMGLPYWQISSTQFHPNWHIHVGLIDWLIDEWIDLHWVRALMGPMHLGLIDGPFVPHNLDIISGDPNMAPRLKILLSSGFKRGTQICCSWCVQALLYVPCYITLFINPLAPEFFFKY
jgi:hypothetical protein